MAPRRPVFSGCFNCHGANGCPRDVGNSIRCTASQCKKALTQRNKEARLAADAGAPAVAAQPALADEMPDNMTVHELTEILGERCCKVHELDPTRRRSGPLEKVSEARSRELGLAEKARGLAAESY